MVSGDGEGLVTAAQGWGASLCSRGALREHLPLSQTRAQGPWQEPVGIKGTINPQLLCKGGAGAGGTQGAA